MAARLRAISRSATILLATTAATLAHSAITELAITSKEPYGAFTAGGFMKIEAEARGTLSPSESIPGLDKAPRNAKGLVEYRTPVTLIIPETPTAGNGTLIVDVPNRGRPITHGLYNSPRSRPILVGSLDQGTGFLQDRGFSVAVVQWELGEGPTLPSFESGGKKLYAEGVAFAAIRDVAMFLRNAPAPGNPLAGAVERTIAVGYSQTARVMKTFLVQGFNESVGRMVFDGMHIVNAAAGVIPLLATGAGPGSVAAATPSFLEPDVPGVHVEPFTYADAMKAAQAKNKKLPLVIVNHTYNDYMGGRASLTRTGAKGTADLPIPSNVRMYDIAGAPHTNARDKNKDCDEGQGQIDWSPAMRAQISSLDDWIRGKAQPPANRLMSLEARPNDPDLFQAPKYLAGATVMGPKVDADHNPIDGVRLPDILVPIASHGFMNSPRTVQACRQAGTYFPFAKTKADRTAKNDARLSLEERYPGGINEYMTKMNVAVARLVEERLLLPEDAAVIVNAAAENPSFAPTKPRARGATTAR